MALNLGVERLIASKRQKFDSCKDISEQVEVNAIMYLTSHTKVAYGGKQYCVSQLGQPDQHVISMSQTVMKVVSAAAPHYRSLIDRSPPQSWERQTRMTELIAQNLDDAPSIPLSALDGLVKVSLCSPSCYLVYSWDC